MGWLSDIFDFERSNLTGIWDQIQDDPERLLLGAVDPASTKLWSGVLGKDWDPMVNQWGGATDKAYADAAAKGINVGPGAAMHSVAQMIASYYAGNYFKNTLGTNPIPTAQKIGDKTGVTDSGAKENNAPFNWTPAMQMERATGLDGFTSAFAGFMGGGPSQAIASMLTGSGQNGSETSGIFNFLGGLFSGGGMATSPGGSGSSFDFTKLFSSGSSGGGGADGLTGLLTLMGENGSGYSGASGGGSMDILGSLGSIFGGGGGGSSGSFGGGDLGQLIGSAFDLFGGGKETKPVTWNNWDPKLLELLQGSAAAVTPELTSSVKQYNKETAIADAAGVVDSIFRQFQQQLPQVFNQQTARGAFNSTATQGLVDQAQGEAVAKASQAVLDNIKTYSAIRQGDISVLSQMLGQGKGSISGGVPSGGGKSEGDMLGDVIKIGAKLFGM